MLSLDFADTAIIEIIATARIMAAIVPNSGTTTPSLISTSVEVVYFESSYCCTVTVYRPSCFHNYPPTIISAANSPSRFGDI